MITNCLILARKNSERIKKKNMIKFNNKPIIYWTLKHAFSSKVFNKIILSSDWNELLNYSKSKFKKLIINKRPLNLSKSNIKSEKVINYLFKKYKFSKGYTVLLQPTSPLRKFSYIRLMLNLLKRKKLNTLHSISEVKNKTYIKKKNNFYKVPKPKKNKKFFLNGSIYIFDNNYFKKTNSIKEVKGNYFFNEKKYSLDLDTLNDLKKFNLKYFFNKKGTLFISKKKYE